MPRRRVTRAFGQHMLVDRQILARIIEGAGIGREETVCEAGAGQGVLTAELCKRARRVISYEIDSKLYEKACEQLLPFHNVELVNADLFKTSDLHFDVFVSNLPYSRSRDAFEWLATQRFKRAVVMVQQEFADKLAAGPGDYNYRAISALATHCFAIEKLFGIGRQSFEPRPLIESAMIKVIPTNTATRETIKSLNLLFSKRNKKASSVAAKVGISADFGNKRIDQLSIGEVFKLAGSMKNIRSI
jgi:16S rRNA (adenine1518-N6/adenine1519-N6)-dimethyltransferase